jgi:hypothetical protein
MEEQEMINFIDQCQYRDVTFVATEFGAPSFPLLVSDPRVILITCLRDPLSRFISHFYYDYYRGSTDALSPEQFVNSGNFSTMSNYYCRIFSMHNNDPDPIGLEHYDIAVSTLNSFDCCVVLEREDPFQGLFRLLEWKEYELRRNQTRMDFLTAIRYMAKGELGLLLRRFTHPRRKASAEFARRFEEENFLDYMLYENMRKTA